MSLLIAVMGTGKAYFNCGAHIIPRSGTGDQYISGSPNVFIEGKPVVRIGDQQSDSCGHNSTANEGSSTVFVNGIPVHRLYDGTDKGYCAVPGQNTVFAG